MKQKRRAAPIPAGDQSGLSPVQIREVRVISDLRIMHALVSQLYHHIQDLRERYGEEDILRYSDQELLTQDIQRNDDTYQFFVALAAKRRLVG